jgi:hypothetical protein
MREEKYSKSAQIGETLSSRESTVRSDRLYQFLYLYSTSRVKDARELLDLLVNRALT